MVFKYFDKVKCREERQYALFLYNKIQKDKNFLEGMLKKSILNINAVYYEFAYMRDVFFAKSNKDKESFNKELLTFCIDIINDLDKESIYKILKEKSNDSVKIASAILQEMDTKKCAHHNLGHVKHTSKEMAYNEVLFLAKCMMNAKPDIVIWYQDKDKKTHLISIECKYGQNIDKYKSDKAKNQYTQIDIQDYVMQFVCKMINTEIERDNTVTIRFVDEADVKNKAGEINVVIDSIL